MLMITFSLLPFPLIYWFCTCDFHILIWILPSWFPYIDFGFFNRVVHILILDLPLWFPCFGFGHGHDWWTFYLHDVCDCGILPPLPSMQILRFVFFFHFMLYDVCAPIGYLKHLVVLDISHGSDHEWFLPAMCTLQQAILRTILTNGIASCTWFWSLAMTLWPWNAWTDCSWCYGCTCHLAHNSMQHVYSIWYLVQFHFCMRVCDLDIDLYLSHTISWINLFLRWFLMSLLIWCICLLERSEATIPFFYQDPVHTENLTFGTFFLAPCCSTFMNVTSWFHFMSLHLLYFVLCGFPSER